MDKILTFNGKIAAGGGRWITRAGSTPDPYNPLGLPPYTIRVQFKNGVTPTFPSTRNVTQVSVTPNVWDVSTSDGNWSNLLERYTITYSPIAVLGANSTGVYTMTHMFLSCNLLTNVTLFDTSSVTDMSWAFAGCYNITSIPLFDTSSATDMSRMFDDCQRLSTVPLFNTSSVEYFNRMFSGCYALTTVPLFDTSRADDMSYMFYNCRSLTSAPLFNTRLVGTFSNMFAYCSSLTSVPLFDTSSAYNMFMMFSKCEMVETGALALYTQASTQAFPPTSHDGAFEDCGSNTVQGAQELAQIPDDWK